MLIRLFGFVLAAVVSATTSSGAADCTRYEEMLAPVAANFAGTPTRPISDVSLVLSTPVRGADSCTVAKMGSGRARAGLGCVWSFPSTGEAGARQLLKDWSLGLQGCRSHVKPAATSAPLQGNEVERSIFKASDGDESWLFRLSRKPDETWTVSVVASMKNVRQAPKADAPPLYKPASTSSDCEPFRTFVGAAQSGFAGIPTRDAGGDKIFVTPLFDLNACIVGANGRGARCVTEDRRATGPIWAENREAKMLAQAAQCLPGWTRSAVAPGNNNYRQTVLTSPDGRVRFGVTYSYYEPVATLTAFANLQDTAATLRPIPTPAPAAAKPAPPAPRHAPPTCAALKEMLDPVWVNFKNSTIATTGERFLTPPVAGAENCVPIKRTALNRAAAISCTWRIDAPSESDARSIYGQWKSALWSCKSQLPSDAPKSSNSATQLDDFVLGEQFAPERWSISLHRDNPYRIVVFGMVRGVSP